MDWQIIFALGVSAGSLIAYFALGRTPTTEAQQTRRRQIQGYSPFENRAATQPAAGRYRQSDTAALTSLRR
jgi:hypothetical protein